MKTSLKIIEYIRKKGKTSGRELADYLGISDRAVRKQLKSLLEKERLSKVGRPPKVYYSINGEKAVSNDYKLSREIKRIIRNRYLIITPAGEVKPGIEGFIYWCQKNNLEITKTAKEYITTLKKYDAFVKDGYINGLKKLKASFNKVNVGALFYLDFYSMERFGKTKLGQLLLYAKQSQEKELIAKLALTVKPKATDLIEKYKIDAVGFIPPTVKREVQFIKELKKMLKLPAQMINIVKVKTPVRVPQKTLSKLADRVENAKTSIIIDDGGVYNNILLIDDAVGSGATINETAGQIIVRKMCKGKIIGLAITGSFKGFDVISEV